MSTQKNSGQKYANSNLNQVFAKSSAPTGTGQGGSNVNRYGGMLVLSKRPTRASAAATGTKLAVPKPVNLPSIKKEYAGNDPNTQIVPAGSSGGWTKPEEPVAQVPPDGRPLALTAGSNWATQQRPPPSGPWQPPAPGEAVPSRPKGPSYPVDRRLNPEEYPSLAATVKPQGPGHVRPPPHRPAEGHQDSRTWADDDRDVQAGPLSGRGNEWGTRDRDRFDDERGGLDGRPPWDGPHRDRIRYDDGPGSRLDDDYGPRPYESYRGPMYDYVPPPPPMPPKAPTGRPYYDRYSDYEGSRGGYYDMYGDALLFPPPPPPRPQISSAKGSAVEKAAEPAEEEEDPERKAFEDELQKVMAGDFKVLKKEVEKEEDKVDEQEEDTSEGETAGTEETDTPSTAEQANGHAAVVVEAALAITVSDAALEPSSLPTTKAPPQKETEGQPASKELAQRAAERLAARLQAEAEEEKRRKAAAAERLRKLEEQIAARRQAEEEQAAAQARAQQEMSEKEDKLNVKPGYEERQTGVAEESADDDQAAPEEDSWEDKDHEVISLAPLPKAEESQVELLVEYGSPAEVLPDADMPQVQPQEVGLPPPPPKPPVDPEVEAPRPALPPRAWQAPIGPGMKPALFGSFDELLMEELKQAPPPPPPPPPPPLQVRPVLSATMWSQDMEAAAAAAVAAATQNLPAPSPPLVSGTKELDVTNDAEVPPPQPKMAWPISEVAPEGPPPAAPATRAVGKSSRKYGRETGRSKGSRGPSPQGVHASGGRGGRGYQVRSQAASAEGNENEGAIVRGRGRGRGGRLKARGRAVRHAERLEVGLEDLPMPPPAPPPQPSLSDDGFTEVKSKRAAREAREQQALPARPPPRGLPLPPPRTVNPPLRKPYPVRPPPPQPPPAPPPPAPLSALGDQQHLSTSLQPLGVAHLPSEILPPSAPSPPVSALDKIIDNPVPLGPLSAPQNIPGRTASAEGAYAWNDILAKDIAQSTLDETVNLPVNLDPTPPKSLVQLPVGFDRPHPPHSAQLSKEVGHTSEDKLGGEVLGNGLPVLPADLNLDQVMVSPAKASTPSPYHSPTLPNSGSLTVPGTRPVGAGSFTFPPPRDLPTLPPGVSPPHSWAQQQAPAFTQGPSLHHQGHHSVMEAFYPGTSIFPGPLPGLSQGPPLSPATSSLQPNTPPLMLGMAQFGPFKPASFNTTPSPFGPLPSGLGANFNQYGAPGPFVPTGKQPDWSTGPNPIGIGTQSSPLGPVNVPSVRPAHLDMSPTSGSLQMGSHGPSPDGPKSLSPHQGHPGLPVHGLPPGMPPPPQQPVGSLVKPMIPNMPMGPPGMMGHPMPQPPANMLKGMPMPQMHVRPPGVPAPPQQANRGPPLPRSPDNVFGNKVYSQPLRQDTIPAKTLPIQPPSTLGHGAPGPHQGPPPQGPALRKDQPHPARPFPPSGGDRMGGRGSNGPHISRGGGRGGGRGGDHAGGYTGRGAGRGGVPGNLGGRGSHPGRGGGPIDREARDNRELGASGEARTSRPRDVVAAPTGNQPGGGSLAHVSHRGPAPLEGRPTMQGPVPEGGRGRGRGGRGHRGGRNAPQTVKMIYVPKGSNPPPVPS